ncbi:MAG: helix-turn-helix domain-containing protein [Rhodospirillales bacterium]|nr:helix-turn-helix domain-containing protein [Rhodospirillales bacterium]
MTARDVDTDSLADDLLYGAEAIANYLGLSRRQVYNLIENRAIPVSKLGSLYVGRRSTYRQMFDEREARSVGALD